MEKMINSAKFFYTFIKHIHNIFKVVAWICGVVAALVWFVPKNAFQGGEEMLSFGPVTITRITDGVLAPEWVRLRAFEILLLACVGLVFVGFALRVVRRILEPMSQGRPFQENVADDINKLAWICLIGGLMVEIAKTAGIALHLGQQDLMVYFNPAMVSKVAVEYSFSTWYIWVFALLMLMSHVFRYGQQLQQLSDETL